jgi:hypothetical protein
MTKPHRAGTRQPSLFLCPGLILGLALAVTLLPGCRSPEFVDNTARAEAPPAWARTNPKSTTAKPATARRGTAKPVAAAARAGNNVDRAYLQALQQLDEERAQAMEDARLKELAPGPMLELTQSFETRRNNLTAQWELAKARRSGKASRRTP